VAEPLPICYLNGSLMPLREARVSPLDRSFLFGDGVYEVIPARRGQPRDWRRTWRGCRSLRELRIRNPLSDAQWRASSSN
jgi:D-alanine transaminase